LKKRISCLQDGTLVWIEKQAKRIPILPQRETAVAYEEKKYIPRRFGGKTDIEILKTCFDAHLNVLLVGESGTGKNAAVKAFCEKFGQTYQRISLNGASTVEDMVGTKELEQGLNTSFRDGDVIFAPYETGFELGEDDCKERLHNLLTKMKVNGVEVKYIQMVKQSEWDTCKRMVRDMKLWNASHRGNALGMVLPVSEVVSNSDICNCEWLIGRIENILKANGIQHS
jgi:hypothetical protein